MLTNVRADRVAAVRALAGGSARRRTGWFLAEGPQCVREAVGARPDIVREVYVDPAAADRYAAVVEAAGTAGIPVHEASAEVLARMCDATHPQGLLAVCRALDVDLATLLDGTPRVLAVLAAARDPGNAGTVIRSADAAGADGVVLSDASVDPYNPKVVRATAGSLFHLPIVLGPGVEELVGLLAGRGLATLATDASGPSSLDTVDLDRPHAWIFGNEAWGLPGPVVAACSDTVRVPIHGRAESLNLAMAATLCLYASARYRPTGPRSDYRRGVGVQSWPKQAL